MVRSRYVSCPADHELAAGFERVRSRLGIAETFPDDALVEADEVSVRGPKLPPGVPQAELVDHRGIELVAIDPPGSRDIDQAFSATRTKHGYLVHYAIADLGSFVTPDGAIDTQARERGLTFYSPDMRASLHPEAINHGVASLLPGEDRSALMWSIQLDHDGTIHDARLERALVRNREAISYREAHGRLGRPGPPEVLLLLREIGRLRQELERRRHAVSLRLPSQEIRPVDGTYRLMFDEQLPIEGWNAQISLLTGMAAADLMVGAGTGILRTLPPPWRDTVAELRQIAAGLHIGWDAQVGYAERVRELDPTIPAEAAMLSASARGLRGAGYIAFTDDEVPRHLDHSAIAAVYAHVTAPLRRLCDRFANEIVLAVCGDYPIPEWVLASLDDIPPIMGRARDREGRLERGLLDFMEAASLVGSLGQLLDAVVSGRHGDKSIISIADPAVVATIDDPDLELGRRLRVRVANVYLDEARIELDPVT